MSEVNIWSPIDTLFISSRSTRVAMVMHVLIRFCTCRFYCSMHVRREIKVREIGRLRYFSTLALEQILYYTHCNTRDVLY